MRLDAILQKTHKKGEKGVLKKLSTPIALDDRPYDLPEQDNKKSPGKSHNNHKQDICGQNIDKETLIIQEMENQEIQTPISLDERENKPVTKGIQYELNRSPITENKQVTKEELSGQIRVLPQVEKKVNKPVTNREETGYTSIIFLVGLQRAILFFLYQDCKRKRSKITDPMTLEHIGAHTKASKGVVKTTLRRLEEKRYINRIDFKNGRGGWTRYELPESVYREAVQLEMDQQDNHQQWLPLFPKPDNSMPLETKKIEVVLEETSGNMPPEWVEIDITPLEDIKFTKNHLYQIYRTSKLTPDIVQDSIYAFAFDMKENKKADSLKLSPLNFFMGILRKDSPYLPPQNYESPADKAMRLYVKSKKEREAQRLVQEEQALEVAYKEWETTLSQEDIQVICPHPCADDPHSIMRKGFLYKHFKEKIWPQRRLELTQG